MSWYRTYRPTTVSGLHLTSVRNTLQQMMQRGVIPHALLFAGPKGTGKTSAARIISAMLNDPGNAAQVEASFFGQGKGGGALHEPDSSHEITQRIQKGNSFAVQELDAASNRGIDDIRQLKERIFLPPQEGKVTVYILDEVHMLTTEAFNALLKILEEPPAHVVFILATTELHKVPETIVSRCTLIQFHKASPEELSSALSQILDQEHTQYDPTALQLLAERADGSFRDAVKMLEQVASGKQQLSVADISTEMGASLHQHVHQFIQVILHKDEKQVIQFFQDMRQRSNDQVAFHKAVLQYLHHDLESNYVTSENKPELPTKVSLFLLSQLSSLPFTQHPTIPFLSLELKALELILKSKEQGSKSNPPDENRSKKKANSASSTVNSPELAATTVAYTSLQPDTVANVIQLAETPHLNLDLPAAPSSTLDQVNTQYTTSSMTTALVSELEGDQLFAKWEEFLQQVKNKNSSIAALLRSSKPVAGEKGKAKIEVYYQFHREQLQQPKFQRLIDECVESLLGGKLVLEFVLADQAKAATDASNISGQTNEEDQLIKLAKEILV